MKVIFRLKPTDYLDMEDCVNLARNIKNTWDNMKDLDAMVISKDIEVYVADDDSEVEMILDGEQKPKEAETIPVEWIKEQLKKEEYRAFLVDYIEWGNCLRWLLEKWEKENE